MLEICLLFFLMSGSSAWFLFYFFLHICTPQNLRVLSARSQRFPITVNTMIAYTETENRSALKTIQRDTHTVQIGRYRKPCKLHCITTFHNCADYWFWPPFIFIFFLLSVKIYLAQVAHGRSCKPIYSIQAIPPCSVSQPVVELTLVWVGADQGSEI